MQPQKTLRMHGGFHIPEDRKKNSPKVAGARVDATFEKKIRHFTFRHFAKNSIESDPSLFQKKSFHVNDKQPIRSVISSVTFPSHF